MARSLDTRGSAEQRPSRCVELLWSASGQRYFWGSVELWTATRTDPRLRATLLPEERRLGAAVRRVVDALFGPGFTGHPRYPLVREMLLSSMRGIALTYSFDQERDRTSEPHMPMWRAVAASLLEQD